MKDARFIELLNLYIDQQIDPADAAQLEAEILRNPERRRTYLLYCRMHRACSLMLDESRADAAGGKLTAAMAAAESKMVEFPEPRLTAARIVYVGGLLAAAAAVAFVFYPRGTPPAGHPAAAAPAGEQIVQLESVPAVSPAADSPRYVDVFYSRGPRQLVGGIDPAGLAWISELKLTPFTPVTAEEVKVTPRAQLTDFHPQTPADPDASEMSAYRFSR